MPKVSVIMPVYNADRFLSQAISSVLLQSFLDFELIIINDGSHDNSDKIVRSFIAQDGRITYLVNTQNQGLIYCLNRGLSESKGEYIARLDGDDWWLCNDKLEKQAQYLDSNEQVGLVGTLATVFNEDDKKLFNLVVPSSDFEIREKILIKNCFIHSSVMFRKGVALGSGFYNKEEQYVEDYGLWLRIGQQMKFYNLPYFMVGYRIQVGSETVKNNLSQTRASLNLIKKNKTYYPNYFFGYLKWTVRYFSVWFLGVSLFTRLKSFVKS